jgi:predicted RNase H-like nuclease (RuvC/YqgF family)
MSEHRIAWTLHNFEMEQTIIRLRNTRNRLLERNNGTFPGAEAIETYRDEIRRLERELQDMKLYASYLEDNMSPEALRFAQAGFDIEKARIPIAG